MRDSASEAISPAISAMASPWKIGSNRITPEPTTTAAAVSIMGRKRTAPGIDHRFVQRHALLSGAAR